MPCRGICYLEPKLYDALKTFEDRLRAAFPGIGCRLTNPFGVSDIGVELILPLTPIPREELMKIAELA
jgi:hypothetical protein